MDLTQFVSVSLILALDAVILFLIYLGVTFFRLKQRKQPFEKMHASLKTGQEVLLTGGLYGKITDIKGDVVYVELAPKLVVKASRYAIQSVEGGA